MPPPARSSAMLTFSTGEPGARVTLVSYLLPDHHVNVDDRSYSAGSLATVLPSNSKPNDEYGPAPPHESKRSATELDTYGSVGGVVHDA